MGPVTPRAGPTGTRHLLAITSPPAPVILDVSPLDDDDKESLNPSPRAAASPPVSTNPAFNERLQSDPLSANHRARARLVGV